jgi:hypothetical protein
MTLGGGAGGTGVAGSCATATPGAHREQINENTPTTRLARMTLLSPPNASLPALLVCSLLSDVAAPSCNPMTTPAANRVVAPAVPIPWRVAPSHWILRERERERERELAAAVSPAGLPDRSAGSP